MRSKQYKPIFGCYISATKQLTTKQFSDFHFDETGNHSSYQTRANCVLLFLNSDSQSHTSTKCLPFYDSSPSSSSVSSSLSGLWNHSSLTFACNSAKHVFLLADLDFDSESHPVMHLEPPTMSPSKPSSSTAIDRSAATIPTPQNKTTPPDAATHVQLQLRSGLGHHHQGIQFIQ